MYTDLLCIVTDMKNKGIQKAIRAAGTQQALADMLTKRLGRTINQQAVSYYLNGGGLALDLVWVCSQEYGIEIKDFVSARFAA